MITTAKILRFDANQILLAPDEPISRDLINKNIHSIELRLSDGRTISNDQRKKAYAIIRDIAWWNGDVPEDIKHFLKGGFCHTTGCPMFSMSDVDMTTAKDFISYLIDFCFQHDVPTKDTLLNMTDDIGKYLYACLAHRKCAICNDRAEVHHVDRVGMGFDREKIVHIGLRAIALCRVHHEQAHQDELRLFEDNHIYGIKLDENLCKILNLNTKRR